MELEQKSYDDLVARQKEILQILQSEKVQLQEQVDDLKKEQEQIQKLLTAYKSSAAVLPLATNLTDSWLSWTITDINCR